MDSKAEYLQLLAERSRLRRQSQSKSKAELELEKKERGFSTHFSGANASSSEKQAVKNPVAKLGSPGVIKETLLNLPQKIPAGLITPEDMLGNGGDSEFVSNRRRSKWGEPAGVVRIGGGQSAATDNSYKHSNSSGNDSRNDNRIDGDRTNIRTDNKNNNVFDNRDSNRYDSRPDSREGGREVLDNIKDQLSNVETEYLEDFEEISDSEQIEVNVVAPPVTRPKMSVIDAKIANAVKHPNNPVPASSLRSSLDKDKERHKESKVSVEIQQNVSSPAIPTLDGIMSGQIIEEKAPKPQSNTSLSNPGLNSTLVSQILTMGDSQKLALLQLLQSNINTTDKPPNVTSSVSNSAYNSNLVQNKSWVDPLTNESIPTPRSPKSSTARPLEEPQDVTATAFRLSFEKSRLASSADKDRDKVQPSARTLKNDGDVSVPFVGSDRQPSPILKSKCSSPKVNMSPKGGSIAKNSSFVNTNFDDFPALQVSESNLVQTESDSKVEKDAGLLPVTAENDVFGVDLEPSRVVNASTGINILSNEGTDVVLIRIKIMSLWQKSKVGGLSCLVLRSIDSELNDNKFINLNTKVLSGLDLLSGTSDAVRLLPSLMADISHRKLFPDEKSLWKGPVGSDKPLEVHIQCPLDKKQIKSFEILIVNSWGAVSVKDVDVYLDSQCIWSGELPNTSHLKHRRELPNFINEALFRPDWSIHVPLVSSQVKSSIKKGNITSAVENSSSNSKPKILESIRELNKVESVLPRGSTPIWLDEATTRPSSSSKSSSNDAGVSVVLERDPIDLQASSSSPKGGRRSSRKRNPTENSKSENMEASKFNLMGPKDKKQAEKELRTSMDALSISEKRNLGRLDKSIEKMSSNSVVDSIDGTAFKEAILSDSNQSKVQSELFAGYANMALEIRQAESKSRAGMRINKINEVTKNVSSALNDVTSIISGLKDINHTKITSVIDKISSTIDKKDVAPNMATKNTSYFSPILDASLKSLESRSNDSPNRINDLVDSISASKSAAAMPEGQCLTINIFSTWGDHHYVGLNGIDIFDDQGKIISLASSKLTTSRGFESKVVAQSIHANPSDINILPEYEKDPRTASNLLNGVNFTRNDMNMWLAPVGYWSPEIGDESFGDLDNEPIASIKIQFSKKTKISMIRIFNYNKSRTHVQRGVKNCKLKLDTGVIFEGTIRMANGDLTSADECSEVILFCTEVETLHAISKYDEKSCYYTKDMTEEWIKAKKNQETSVRPGTAETKENMKHARTTSIDERPSTSIGGQSLKSSPSSSNQSKPRNTRSPESKIESKKTQQKDSHTKGVNSKEIIVTSKNESSTTHRSSSNLALNSNIEITSIDCRKLEISIISSWGDNNYVGLSGLELYDCNNLKIHPSNLKIDAEPRDLRDIGANEDPRVLENLNNGVNNTTNDIFMWLAPFTPGTANRIEISFNGVQSLSSICFWNYNKPGESLLRGVKNISLIADGVILGHWILNMAPGVDGMNFCQKLLISNICNGIYCKLPGISIAEAKRPSYLKYITPALRQDYETHILPSGCTWKITILENWHDDYYVGLDLLQFIDVNGDTIDMPALQSTIRAVPSSIEDANPGTRDNRVPDNLIRSVEPKYDMMKWDSVNSWLAPLSRSMTGKEKLGLVQNCLANCNTTPFGNNNIKKYKEYLQSLDNGNIDEIEFPNDNTIFISFPYPMKVAGLRFFNYSKTPTRGVKDFSIHVDGNLIYMGSLNSSETEFSNGITRVPQAVLFTNDPKIIRSEKSNVFYCGSVEQDVLYINERQVMVRSKDMYNRKPNIASEGVYADIENRPKTSSVHK